MSHPGCLNSLGFRTLHRFDCGNLAGCQADRQGAGPHRLVVHVDCARAHIATPHPNFVPVRPRLSRSTQSKGVSSSTSTCRSAPFTLSLKIIPTPSRRTILYRTVRRRSCEAQVLSRSEKAARPARFPLRVRWPLCLLCVERHKSLVEAAALIVESVTAWPQKTALSRRPVMSIRRTGDEEPSSKEAPGPMWRLEAMPHHLAHAGTHGHMKILDAMGAIVEGSLRYGSPFQWGAKGKSGASPVLYPQL